MFNLSAAVSLIALLLYCVLLVIVIRRDFKSRLHLSFAIYLVSMVIWSLGSFMIFADLGFLSTLFWNRFLVIGSMGMPVAFFGFAQNFLMKDRRNWLYLGILSYLVTQILNLLGLVITSAYLQDDLLYNHYSGVGVVFSSLSWVFFVSLLGYDLFEGYRSTRDSLYRNRLKYLLIVTVLTFAGSLTNVTKLQVFPVDIAFNAVSAILIAYIIFRHHFLDINLVVRKGLLYSIPTIVIGATYFLIISLALNLFHTFSGSRLFLLSLFVAIVTAVVAQPLRDRAQLFIDRLFFREKYDATLMLQRVSRTAAAVLDLDRLTHLILAEVTTTLQIERAAFFTRQEDSDEFSLIAHLGMDPSPHFKLGATNPIVLWLAQNQRPLTRGNMDVLPQFKALWGHERLDLDLIAAELFIPLLVSGSLVGYLALGPKRSGLSFSEDDQLTLTTLANQTAVAIENARLFSVETQRRHEAELLHHVFTEMKSDLDLKSVLESVLVFLNEVVPYDSACVFLIEKDSLCIVSARGFPNVYEIISQRYPISNEPYFQEISKTGRQIYISNVQPNLHFNYIKTQIIQSWLGMPLIVGQDVIGFLTLHSQKISAFNNFQSTLVTGFANHAAIAIENARLFMTVQELAITDELTGIINRRHLFELGEQEFNRARRFERHLSVIMIDLDQFKSVNDTFGHWIGDEVLKAVAKRCQNSIRNFDILGRYGGEEFTVVLPETSLSDASVIAERLRSQIGDNPISTDAGIVTVTASLGVASYSSEIEDFIELFRNADLALYNAKQEGRNRWQVYPEKASIT